MSKGIWAAALVGAGFIATSPAEASTVSSGWVRNTVLTQAMCLSIAHQVAEDGSFRVTSTDVSASLKNDAGDMIIIVCDAAPYVFFIAVHDTKPAAEVEALADWTEARLSARIEPLH